MMKNNKPNPQPAIVEPVNPLRAPFENVLKSYDDLMCVEEVSAVLRASKKLVYHLLKTGAMGSVSIGRRKLIAKEWVVDYLCRQSATGSQSHR